MNLRPVVRATAPIAAAASLTLLLAACGSSSNTPQSKASPSASPTASSTTTPADACKVQSGSATSAVTVSGAFGKTPSVKVSGTVKATDIERNVVIKGTGATPADGTTVNAHLTLLNGSGKKLAEQDAQVPLGSGVRPVFLDALECAAYGSRVVVTAPATQVYDSTSMPKGVKKTDSLIIVADLKSAFAPVAWTTQVPTVTFDSAGKPTVKLHGKPMTAWALKVLRPGTGAAVKAGDNVTVNYQGTSWNTGKIFDQSYGRGEATFNTTQVVQGFGGALVGQKVGTRLVVTIPPALAYGTSKSDTSGLGGQTLVFVIEIIKTAAGS